jgi:type II secretory pathway pseudopilin PulG
MRVRLGVFLVILVLGLLIATPVPGVLADQLTDDQQKQKQLNGQIQQQQGQIHQLQGQQAQAQAQLEALTINIRNSVSSRPPASSWNGAKQFLTSAPACCTSKAAIPTSWTASSPAPISPS